MELGNDYWNALDKYTAQLYSINPTTLGIPTPPFKDHLESLKSRIFQGVSQVELGFSGRGKGSLQQGSTTPEMFGKEERDAMRELAKINEAKLTTHATFATSGFSGFTDRGFMPEEQENVLFELRRAIDFAADTTRGGPIVAHSGEFPRPILEYAGERFEGYPGEKERAPVYLADKRTGEISMLRRDTQLPYPKGGWENPQRDEYGRVEWYMRKFADFEKEAKQRGEKDVGKFFYDEYLKRELRLNQGEETRWSLVAKDNEEALDYMKQQLNSLRDLAKRNQEVANYQARQIFETNPRLRIPTGTKKYEEFFNDPLSYLSETIKKQELEVSGYQEISHSYGIRAHDIKQRMDNIRPIQEIALDRSAQTLARAGIIAYDTEKQRNLSEPLFIAPENLFPESGYGSHPRELKKLIQESRMEMTNKLVKDRGMDESQAKKIAEDHIKATFDIGHLNTWRKYFQGTDAEFNSWIGRQIEELTKDNIIGHVHISDNFGYYDEHVSPGEGKAPIAGFIKKLKEAGYKGPMIVEPAHQDIRAWTRGMRNLQSPIYRIDAASTTWTDIEHSYFGKTASPLYLVGEGVVPDPREWTLWSQTPIE